ncbi:geranylgeranyl reductase family protein [Candidatus Woesearchaeota archaeon]|nr:geranylgeranyl reductase family protein [Candidatus Woesearchaeota archaeon]
MIIIIGAGPTGCFLGGLLAKAGKEVSIYEEHSCIGRPVQCTGIVTKDIENIIKLKDKFIVNKVEKIRVYSKNNKVEIPTDDIVLDREKFDKYLAEKAKEYGAKICLEHKFLGIKGKKAVFADKNNKIKTVKAEYIIGADGVLSDVSKANAMFDKRKFYLGIQARVKGKYDRKKYEVYLGSVCDDFFGWVVPESENIARVGIASKKNAKKKFREFLKIKKVEESDIIEYQGGLIPVYDKNQMVKRKDVFLIGDAAGQVKATTGGGIVPGLRAAKILTDCLINGKDYRKRLRKLNRELKIHLKIRKILNKFTDKDYNRLIEIIDNKKVKRVLNKYSRDNPVKLILGILLKKPSIVKYTTKFIN